MGICSSCNYGKNHICPEQNVYRTVCSFKDPNRKTKTKKENEVPDVSMENMKIIRRKDVAICDDYKAGMTIEELATKYNLHRTTIPRILKKCDVPLRNPKPSVPCTPANKISQETVEAVFKEFSKGTIATDIHNKYGLTRYRIGQLKKQWRAKIEEEENAPAAIEKPVVKKEVEPEVPALPATKHYIYYSGKTKPSAMFAPAEFNDELIWAAEIKSLDDIFAVAAEAGVSMYEVKDGNLFASTSGQIVLTNEGITINPTIVAEAVDASISQARNHAVV